MARIEQDSAATGMIRWFHAAKPVLYWLPVAAAIWAWDIHQKRAAGTHLEFTVEFEGRSLQTGFSAELNGVAVAPGQVVPRGQGVLRVGYPEAEPHQEEVRIRTGTNYLGVIRLRRARGGLEFDPFPVPDVLSITGRWFFASISNRPFVFSDVPAGDYRITAQYRHFRIEERMEVRAGVTNRLRFGPPVGGLRIASEPAPAEFSLAHVGVAGLNLTGKTPASYSDLPSGNYRLRISRGEYTKEQLIAVGLDTTNDVSVRFEYGSALIDTDPSGATVSNGTTEIGRTPHRFEQMRPGTHRVRLEKEGHQPIWLDFDIADSQETVIRTNLLNIAYAAAMREATSAKARRIDRDLTNAVARALQAKPGDEVALALLREIEAARSATVPAAASTPSSAPAPVSQQPARAPIPPDSFEAPTVKAAATATEDISTLFNTYAKEFKDAELFDLNRWEVPAPKDKVVAAVRAALTRGGVRWKVEAEETSPGGSVKLEGSARTDFLSRQRCLVLVSPLPGDKSVVQAKFTDHAVSRNTALGANSNPNESMWTPVHPSRLRGRQPGDIEARRKSLPDAFWKALQVQIQ